MIKRASAAAAAALLLAGCAGGDPVAAPSASGTVIVSTPTPTEEPNPFPEPEPEPEGDFEHSCDYLLDFDSGHTFVASAFITNTSEVGFIAEVTATWKQANGRHVVKHKKVRVPVGDDDVEAYFSVGATSAQIDQIQALPSERQCDVDVEIVDLLP